jgi:hypothetical protein
VFDISSPFFDKHRYLRYILSKGTFKLDSLVGSFVKLVVVKGTPVVLAVGGGLDNILGGGGGEAAELGLVVVADCSVLLLYFCSFLIGISEFSVN